MNVDNFLIKRCATCSVGLERKHWLDAIQPIKKG